jgi:hypothetical protein
MVSSFSSAFKEAHKRAKETGVHKGHTGDFVRRAVLDKCGPFPIKVPAGYVHDVSQMTDGTPILLLEKRRV